MNTYLTWRRKSRTIVDFQQADPLSSDPKQELWLTVMKASLSPSIVPVMGTNLSETGWKPFIRLVKKNDPRFVVRLAIYMIEKMKDRHVAFALSAALAVHEDNDRLLPFLLDRVIGQPVMLPEWMDCYASVYRSWHEREFHKPDRTVRKALTGIFNRLDEYQYTHYDDRQQIRVRQALSLIRPAAVDQSRQLLFRRIVKGGLAVRRNWQDEIALVERQHYDNMSLKKAAVRDQWENLILSWKIGYTDLVEQLPALLKAGIGGKALKLLAQYLGNAGAVAKNGLMPFRYLEAYRRVKDSGHYRSVVLLEALEKAAILSTENIAGFTAEARVVIAMDVSNSMKIGIGPDSRLTRFDIAPMVAKSLQYRSSRVTTGLFGNTWKPMEMRGNQLLEEVESFAGREGELGYAANAWTVIRDLINKSRIADTVMIFTDCSLWNSRQPNQVAGTDLGQLWRQYKKMAPHAKLCLFDLAAYGSSPLEVLADDVCLVQGWNERIFAVLNAVGKGAAEPAGITISF